MEIRHLRYFCVLAEQLHFTKAALLLNVAQPALSHQIKQLEEELGTQLVERSNRRVRLTAAGEVFLARAARILEQLDQAVRETTRAGQGEFGSLVIGVVSTAVCSVLPELLRSSRREAPGISIDIREMEPAEQVEALRRETMLLAFQLAGQSQPPAVQVRPQVAGRPMRDGQVTTVYLVPRYVTGVRMPEPVNSVVVGDPGSFSAEHSDREPQLVFVKPITSKPAQSNLLISTTRGLQVSLLLVSRGETKADAQANVDFVMRYKPSGQFLVQPADTPSSIVPQTVTLGNEPLSQTRSTGGVSVIAGDGIPATSAILEGLRVWPSIAPATCISRNSAARSYARFHPAESSPPSPAMV